MMKTKASHTPVASVVVVGELNVDMILTGEDIVPEWNREKIANQFEIVLGSSSAITACALVSLGVEVTFVSVVGADYFGEFCIQELQRMGVNTDHIHIRSDIKTGVTLSFSTSSDRGLVTYPGSIPCVTPDMVTESLLREADHLHFGSYYLQDQMREHWSTLFAQAQQLGVSTSFDTGWDIRNLWDRSGIEQLLTTTNLFIPSEEEILHIYNTSHMEEVITKLPDLVGDVIVKLGSQGSLLVDTTKQLLTIRSYPVTPIDTTGAGDCFNAGIIYGYLQGYRRATLLEFANACGALSTQGVGGTGALPTLQQIDRIQMSHS